jgi:cytochrome P450
MLQDIQDQLFAEITTTNTATPTAELLADMPLLTAVIYESLRLFPPIGQLINRRASQPVMLGNDIYIPEGTYLGYNCYSTNRDPSIYGADADTFRPQRWGDNLIDIHRSYRQRKARAELISFHGGRRACLGEKFALLEMKVSLFVLVGSGLKWRLDPTWADRKTPVSFLHSFRSRWGPCVRNRTGMGCFGQSSHVRGTEWMLT